jgi:hypothetical protein
MTARPLNNGRIVRAVNPRDSRKKPGRPAIVLWSDETRALVVFAQSFDTGEGPFFELRRRPGGFLDHDSYFYLTETALLPIANLTWTPMTLSRSEYNRVREFFAANAADLSKAQLPPPSVAPIWAPPAQGSGTPGSEGGPKAPSDPPR